jgi:ABC-type multidrug transport system permease subunit
MTKDNMLLISMTTMLMSAILGIVSLVMCEFFAKEFGTTVAFAMPVSFGVVAVVCKFFVDKLEA